MIGTIFSPGSVGIKGRLGFISNVIKADNDKSSSINKTIRKAFKDRGIVYVYSKYPLKNLISSQILKNIYNKDGQFVYEVN